MEQYPDDLQARFKDLPNFRIPGGESLMDLKARALPALKGLIEEHHEQAFLLVAHAGINRVILSEALGLNLQNLFRLDQNYG